MSWLVHHSYVMMRSKWENKEDTTTKIFLSGKSSGLERSAVCQLVYIPIYLTIKWLSYRHFVQYIKSKCLFFCLSMAKYEEVLQTELICH